MEEEMDRFEAEIQIPGGPPSGQFILRASTFDKVQAQLTSLRQESSRLQQKREGTVEDVDLRQLNSNFTAGQKRKFSPDHDEDDDDDDDDEFHDIDERPGRPQGPFVPPPPPPPPSILRQLPVVHDNNNLFVPLPPPPPPPEPNGFENNSIHSTLSFKPYGPGEGPHLPRPAFLPPQLRHRAPPPGLRPPFPRPPMQMGMPFGGPLGFPRHPHMMMLGQQLHRMNTVGPQGLPVPGVGVPVQQGPQIMPPGPPGVEPGSMPFMTPSLDAPHTESSPGVTEQSKIVYAAAPMITVERKKEEKKKKKKKKKGQTEAGQGGENKDKTATQNNIDGTNLTVGSLPDEDKSILDMEIVPESALVGGIVLSNTMQDASAAAGTVNAQGVTGTGGKKEKKKKDKKFLRLAANTTWEDPTLAEWQQDDFRMFCGDLGNEVTDETLVRAFNKYPSFLKAKVIRDRRSNKTKGYGFVSFKDPLDFARAMREMN
ncbi:unnamed protein product, partial [Candidula unifasciata]